MRYRPIAAPTTHPHIAEIGIDPADLRRLQRMAEDAREVRILDVDDSAADRWTVRVACASERVRGLVEDAWG